MRACLLRLDVPNGKTIRPSLKLLPALRSSERRRLQGRDFCTRSAIERLGSTDGVISLNVGGKSFLTLRSTLAQSPVLERYATKAQENSDLAKDGAVFIDRSPEHFDLVLAHLRNKAEGLGHKTQAAVMKGVIQKAKVLNGKGGSVSEDRQLSIDSDISSDKQQPRAEEASMYTVQLPKDRNKLRDIYLEAVFYELDELRDRTCQASVCATLASFSGGGNPFDKVASIFQQARRLAIVGMGSFLAMFGVDERSADSGGVWERIRSTFATKQLPGVASLDQPKA